MRHVTAARLVPDLVAGQIGGWRRRRLARHARGCADCRAVQKTYAAISDAYRGVDQHPDSERLAVFAISRESLELEERRVIAAHLDRCASCAADLQTIQAVEEGDAPQTGVLTWAPATRRVGPWLRPALAGAGLAVLLLGGPVYVALRGVGIDADSSGDPGQAVAGPSEVAIVPLVVLRTPLRQRGSLIPQVRVEESARTVVLALDVSTWLADLDDHERVRISLRDASLRSLWREAIAAEQIRHAAAANGAIALSVPASVLGSGRFSVAAQRESVPADPLFEVEFEVVK